MNYSQTTATTLATMKLMIDEATTLSQQQQEQFEDHSLLSEAGVGYCYYYSRQLQILLASTLAHGGRQVEEKTLSGRIFVLYYTAIQYKQ